MDRRTSPNPQIRFVFLVRVPHVITSFCMLRLWQANYLPSATSQDGALRNAFGKHWSFFTSRFELGSSQSHPPPPLDFRKSPPSLYWRSRESQYSIPHVANYIVLNTIRCELNESIMIKHPLFESIGSMLMPHGQEKTDAGPPQPGPRCPRPFFPGMCLEPWTIRLSLS